MMTTGRARRAAASAVVFGPASNANRRSPPDAFSRWLEKRMSTKNNGTARCYTCKTAEEEEEERKFAENSRAEVQCMQNP